MNNKQENKIENFAVKDLNIFNKDGNILTIKNVSIDKNKRFPIIKNNT